MLVGWVERSETHHPARLAFTKIALVVAVVACPIHWIRAAPHHSREGRIRPVFHAPYVSMLDRVEMYVIDVPLEILLVAQRMFPVSSLPNTALASGGAARRNRFASGQGAGECRFDQAPAHGKIGVAFRQSPNRMKMLRQHHNRIEYKSVTLPHITECGTQFADMADEKTGFAVGQIDREEIAGAANKVSAVVNLASRPEVA
jgi:hypothetical protein